jgi:hypothetical protein
MASSFLKVPELTLEESEAKQIAQATAKVAEQYELVADPKTIAWAQLVTTVATVYGTRIFAFRMRKAAEHQKSRGAKVSPIRPGDGVMPPFDFPQSPTTN